MGLGHCLALPEKDGVDFKELCVKDLLERVSFTVELPKDRKWTVQFWTGLSEQFSKGMSVHSERLKEKEHAEQFWQAMFSVALLVISVIRLRPMLARTRYIQNYFATEDSLRVMKYKETVNRR